MNGEPIRVLVVDASPSSRARLSAILAMDSELVVVGEASGGEQAIAMAQRLRPDVITMHAQISKQDSFETTMRIMAEAPTPIVIVTTSTQEIAVELSTQALRAGAMTVLKMPEDTQFESFERARQIFARTVKTLASVKVVRRRDRRGATVPRHSERPRARAQVIAIGGSTGGPAALRCILEALSGTFSAPILVTQHLVSGFTEDFTQWLSSACRLRIKVAENGEPLVRGTVYVAPEHLHLRLLDRKIHLEESVPVGGFRPAITTMFESVAHGFGERAVAVLLTGMGRDGVDGLQAVRDHRGFVIAQDEASSVVFGMPRVAIEAGVVDEVLSLRTIGSRLEELTWNEVNP